VLGLNLGIGYGSGSGTGESSSKDNYYAAAVFLRKYRCLGSRFYLFCETAGGFEYIENKYSDSLTNPTFQDNKSKIIYMRFSPVVAYFLSPRWQLEVEFPNVLNAQYIRTKMDYLYPSSGIPPTQPEQKSITNGFSFNTSLTSAFQLVVGLKYLIGS